jgi:hypothetical protein
MNIVLEEAEEYYVKKNIRKPIGRIMLKGDNITLISNITYLLICFILFLSEEEYGSE